MEKAYMETLMHYLEGKGKRIPQYVADQLDHWSAMIYIAQLLMEVTRYETAYELLRSVYQEDTFEFDKDFYGTYEDYIIDRVKLLKDLAKLNWEMTQNAYESIAYLDEASQILDTEESVYPYVSLKEIQQLKKAYLKMYR